jgi:hypothetical protein
VRGERIFAVNGCGFDRIGAALGVYLEGLYSEELGRTLACDTHRPLAGGGSHAARGFHGAYVCADGTVILDGACGLDAMCAIADAIGLSVERDSTRTSTLLVITQR